MVGLAVLQGRRWAASEQETTVRLVVVAVNGKTNGPSDIVKLSGNYGYSSYRFSEEGLDVSAIDALAASWMLANQGAQVNRYPFQVDYADPDGY